MTKFKKCEMRKLDPEDKCTERARHTLQFKYQQIGKKKDIKIRICETHKQIFEDNGVVALDTVRDLEGGMHSGTFSCTLIIDKI